MYTSKHLILFYACVLISLVATVPLNLDVPKNVTNGDEYPIPWGPDTFSCRTESETRLPIEREAAFMSSIYFLAEQALENFDGQMPSHRIVFRDPRYPRLSIAASSPSSAERLQRKYVLWAMARILNQMARDNQFFGSRYTMRFRGRYVGSVFFIAGNTNQLSAGYKDALQIGPQLHHPTLQPTSNTTAVSAIADSGDLEYEFDYKEDLLSMQDVCMGAVGSLIQLAQRTESVFEAFFGTFLGYNSIHLWSCWVTPWILTKRLIIVSMLKTVEYSLQRNDWHECYVLVSKDGEAILKGGYLDRRESSRDLEVFTS